MISDELRASVRFGAINGDSMERGVCERQMIKAAETIEQMQKAIKGAVAALSQNKTFPADIDAAKKWLVDSLPK